MNCKHNWHFVDGLTKRIRCTKCAAMQFTYNKEEMEKYMVSAAQGQTYTLADPRPNNIVFYDTSKGPQREVLRLSPEGITANPEVPTDEAAQAVLRAVDGYLKSMMDRRINSLKYEIGVDSVKGEHSVVVMRDNGNGTSTMVATKTIKEGM